MKCLEKDRTRRYETANGLARDVERYLHDEPVQACPPSARLPAAEVRAAAPGAGAGGGAGAAGPGRRHHRHDLGPGAGRAGPESGGQTAGDRRGQGAGSPGGSREGTASPAVRRRAAADCPGKREESGGRETGRRSRAAVFPRDLLRQANPWEQANALRKLGDEFEAQENPTIKELLERAAVGLTPEKIEDKFPGQREVQASILRTVGDTYRGIGEYGKAADFLKRASDLHRSTVGADHPDTLATLSTLAWAYRDAGRPAEAIALFEQVRDLPHPASSGPTTPIPSPPGSRWRMPAASCPRTHPAPRAAAGCEDQEARSHPFGNPEHHESPGPGVQGGRQAGGGHRALSSRSAMRRRKSSASTTL